jgi:hypothetical protein
MIEEESAFYRHMLQVVTDTLTAVEDGIENANKRSDWQFALDRPGAVHFEIRTPSVLAQNSLYTKTSFSIDYK